MGNAANDDRTPTSTLRIARSAADRELADRLIATLVTPEEAAAARVRKLSRVREAIDASDYENELKLSVAVDRLIERHADRPTA